MTPTAHGRFLRPGGTLLLLAALALSATQARAQLTLSLTPASGTIVQGGSLSILALLSNPVGGQTFSLDAGTGTVTGPSGLLWDDSAFLTGLPLTLAAGASYQNTLLLNAAPNAPLSAYTGTYTLDYSTLAGTPSSVASNVNVTVIPKASGGAVPEPTPLALVACGLAPLLLGRRRSRVRP